MTSTNKDYVVCNACGKIGLLCQCFTREEFNRLSDVVFGADMVANVKTKDGSVMMTVEQYKALCSYINTHNNLPIDKTTTKYITHILKNCVVNP